MITRADFERLIRHRDKPMVTITMPADAPSLALRQDSIRLNNLIGKAKDELVAAGLEQREAESLLRPARQLVDNRDFWAQGRRGLAIFISPSLTRIVDCNEPLEEQVVCGETFAVGGLSDQVRDLRERFFVLALTGSRSTLYFATPEGLAEAELDLPAGIRPAPDQTGLKGTISSNLPVEPESLAKALHAMFSPSHAAVPIVVAAQANTAGHLLQNSHLASLQVVHLDVNPSALDLNELYQRSLDLLSENGLDAVSGAISRLEELRGSSLVATDPGELVKASKDGRMDTLLLSRGAHVWGRYDGETNSVRAHHDPEPDDEDLLELAAQNTVLNGGTVRVVAAEEMPGGLPAAGILRY